VKGNAYFTGLLCYFSPATRDQLPRLRRQAVEEIKKHHEK
jgi:hypothetical protein